MNIVRVTLFSLLFLLSSYSYSHQLAPALLKLNLDSENTATLFWKESESRPRGTQVGPIFPESCQKTKEPSIEQRNKALFYQWQISCSEPLIGQTIKITGMDKSKTNALIVFTDMEGRKTTTLLSQEAFSFTIPSEITAFDTFKQYMLSGIEHLIFGWDHVLFVLGLFAILLQRLKTLFWAVTAFTVGHSITLLSASLGFIPFNTQLVEILIALSITLLAIELLRPENRPTPFSIKERPYVLTFSFGLVHGCGFASVLEEYLSQESSILLPLLSFNIGIEVGQILLLVVAYIVIRVAQLSKVVVPKPKLMTAYIIGSMSIYWLIPRVLG